MKYGSCGISKKNRSRKRNSSSRSLPRRCVSACRRGDRRPKRRTCAGTQRTMKKPASPRVRPKKRFSRSCTHGCIDRHAFVYINGAVHFNTSLRCRARRQDRSACDGSWLHQDLAPVETPAALMVMWHWDPPVPRTAPLPKREREGTDARQAVW